MSLHAPRHTTLLRSISAAALILGLGLLPGMAQAQDRGWYGGISFGQTQVTIDNSFVAVSGATAGTISKDETGSAFKLYAGYRLMRNLAIEGGYTDFGSFSATNNVTAPAAGTLRHSNKVSGVLVDAVGVLPAGSNFEFSGKAGIVFTNTKADFTSTGAVVILGNAHPTHSEANLKFGIGAEYRISRNLGLRLEHELVMDVGDFATTGEGAISMLSLGLTFRF